MAAGPLGTSVMVPGNDNAAYGLKMKGMMLGSASDRFRAANKQIANLVQKMGLPDEVKTCGQVSARLRLCAAAHAAKVQFESSWWSHVISLRACQTSSMIAAS